MSPGRRNAARCNQVLAIREHMRFPVRYSDAAAAPSVQFNNYRVIRWLHVWAAFVIECVCWKTDSAQSQYVSATAWETCPERMADCRHELLKLVSNAS